MQLHQQRSDFEALNTTILLIGFEPVERARDWMQSIEINFPFLIDLNRSVYRAYGLKRSIFRSWHPRSLWFYFKWILRGNPLPKIKADPNQLGGDLIIDTNGIIHLAYDGKDATDRPSAETLLAILSSITLTRDC